MRFLLYAGISAALACAVVGLSLADRPNYFSAAVAISQSSANIIVIVNMLLIIGLLIGKVIQLAFFGQLRTLELEHLYERAWYAVTETFLAMTIFRDEFNFQFSAFFTTLLFLRVFHWISADRVDLIFQSAQPVSLFNHIRLFTALLLLIVADSLLVRHCVMDVLLHGPGMMVMFAFEFVLQENSVLAAFGKYILNFSEILYLDKHPDEDTWERKGLWMFCLDLFTDFSRLLTYIAFFVVMLKPHGIPLHVLRDVYITVISLVTKVRDFIRSRRAHAQMDRHIYNATAEDLIRDNVCIICREEMSIQDDQATLSPRYVPKKLQCGHVIHFGCLKSWLERSQRCPTCRRQVLEDSPNGNTPVQGLAQGQAQGDAQGHDQLDRNNLEQNILNGANPPHFEHPEVILRNRYTGAQQNDTPSEPSIPMNGTSTFTSSHSSSEALPNTSRIVMQPGFTMPSGWSVFRTREVEGNREIQLNSDIWAGISQSPDVSNLNSTIISGTSSLETIGSTRDPSVNDQLLQNDQKIIQRLDELTRRIEALESERHPPTDVFQEEDEG